MLIFSGLFKNGVKNGPGFLSFPNGDFHQGTWENGLKSGYGYSKEKGVWVKIHWVNGLKHGNGRIGCDEVQFENGVQVPVTREVR